MDEWSTCLEETKTFVLEVSDRFDYWRKRFKREIYSIEADCLDEDLAAHLMITKTRGICLFGEPIKKILPVIPEKDYLASNLGDYSDCLKTIHTQPVSAVLNLLRVYWFVLDGTISSKQEAGEWGMTTLPTLYNETIKKALQRKPSDTFNMQELSTFALWIQQNMNRFVGGIN